MSGRPVLIEVDGLWRSFEQVEAVRGLTFNILQGQVVGFIGANGAGKTTTMRIMVTLDLPTSGSVRICGLDVLNHPNEVRKRVGWMPDAYGSYQHMTVYEYLDFFGRSYGFAREERARRVDEVMAFADLLPLASKPMDTLSKGMRQRLCFGRTLVHDPDILVLDEPAAGLDPKARIEFKNLIRLLARRGKTIFISSHILTELAEMCDTFLFIDKGSIVYHGTSSDLKKRESGETVYEIGVAGDPAPLKEWLGFRPGWKVRDEHRQGIVAAFGSTEDEKLAAELKAMVEQGIPVAEFRKQEQKLEDVFVEIVKRRDGEESHEP